MDTLIPLLQAHRAELVCPYHLVVDGAHWKVDATGVTSVHPNHAEWAPETCTIRLSAASLEALVQRPTKGTVLGLALRGRLVATPVPPAVTLAESLSAWMGSVSAPSR